MDPTALPSLAEIEQDPSFTSLPESAKAEVYEGYMKTRREQAKDEDDFNRIIKEDTDRKKIRFDADYKTAHPGSSEYDPDIMDEPMRNRFNELNTQLTELDYNINGAQIEVIKPTDLEDETRSTKIKPFRYNGQSGYTVIYPNGEHESILGVKSKAELAKVLEEQKADKFDGKREGFIDSIIGDSELDKTIGLLTNTTNGLEANYNELGKGFFSTLIGGDIRELDRIAKSTTLFSESQNTINQLDPIIDREQRKVDEGFLGADKMRLAELKQQRQAALDTLGKKNENITGIDALNTSTVARSPEEVKTQLTDVHRSIIERLMEQNKIAGSRTVDKFNRHIQSYPQEEQGTVGALTAYFKKNPSDILPYASAVFSQNIPNLVATVGPSVAAGMVAGPGAAAATGQKIGYSIEYGASLLSSIQLRAANEGKELSPELIQSYLKDEEFITDARNTATTRGAIIGATDAVLGASLAKLVESSISGTFKKALIGGAIGTATEGVGEGLAGLSTTGRINATEVAGEMIGGGGAAVVPVAVSGYDAVKDQFKQRKEEKKAELNGSNTAFPPSTPVETPAERARKLVQDLKQRQGGATNPEVVGETVPAEAPPAPPIEVPEKEEVKPPMEVTPENVPVVDIKNPEPVKQTPKKKAPVVVPESIKEGDTVTYDLGEGPVTTKVRSAFPDGTVWVDWGKRAKKIKASDLVGAESAVAKKPETQLTEKPKLPKGKNDDAINDLIETGASGVAKSVNELGDTVDRIRTRVDQYIDRKEKERKTNKENDSKSEPAEPEGPQQYDVVSFNNGQDRGFISASSNGYAWVRTENGTQKIPNSELTVIPQSSVDIKPLFEQEDLVDQRERREIAADLVKPTKKSPFKTFDRVTYEVGDQKGSGMIVSMGHGSLWIKTSNKAVKEIPESAAKLQTGKEPKIIKPPVKIAAAEDTAEVPQVQLTETSDPIESLKQEIRDSGRNPDKMAADVLATMAEARKGDLKAFGNLNPVQKSTVVSVVVRAGDREAGKALGIKDIEFKRNNKYSLPRETGIVSLTVEQVEDRLEELGANAEVIYDPDQEFEGALLPDGTIVLNAAYLEEASDVDRVFYHEAAHLAERDPDLYPFLQQIVAAIEPEAIEQLVSDIEDMGYTSEAIPSEVIANLVADMNVRFAELPAWRRLIRRIITWAKKALGMNISPEDAQVIAARVVANVINGNSQLTESSDSQYSFSKDLAKDKEYMAAVESGNMSKAQAMVNAAAKAAGYNRKGVRFGFYVKGVPLPPSAGETNFGPGYYVAEDAGENTDANSVSVRPEINLVILNELGLKPEDIEFRRDVVFVKAERPLEGQITPAEKEQIRAEAAYQSAINDAFRSTGKYGWMTPAQIAKLRGDPEPDAAIRIFPGEERLNPDAYQKTLAMLIRKGMSQYDSIRGMTGRKGMSSELVVQHPNQIKSAAAVTYDQNGDIIPLSQRFNLDSDSILYSKKRKGKKPKVSTDIGDISVKSSEVTPEIEALAAAATTEQEKEVAANAAKEAIYKARFDRLKATFPDLYELQMMDYDGKNLPRAREIVLDHLNANLSDTDSDGNETKEAKRILAGELYVNKLFAAEQIEEFVSNPGLTESQADLVVDSMEYIINKTADPDSMSLSKMKFYNHVLESFSDGGPPLGLKHITPKMFTEYQAYTFSEAFKDPSKEFKRPIGNWRRYLGAGMLPGQGSVASFSTEIAAIGMTENAHRFLQQLMGTVRDNVDMMTLERNALEAEFYETIAKHFPKDTFSPISRYRVGLVARLTQYDANDPTDPVDQLVQRAQATDLSIKYIMKDVQKDKAAISRMAYDQIIGTTDLATLGDHNDIIAHLENQLTEKEKAVLAKTRDIGARLLPSLAMVKAITKKAVLSQYVNYVHDSTVTPEREEKGEERIIKAFNSMSDVLHDRKGLNPMESYPELDILGVAAHQIKSATYEKHTGVERFVLSQAIADGSILSTMIDSAIPTRGEKDINAISKRLRSLIGLYHDAMTRSQHQFGPIGAAINGAMNLLLGTMIVGFNNAVKNFTSSFVARYSVISLGGRAVSNMMAYDTNMKFWNNFIRNNFPTQWDRTNRFDVLDQKEERWNMKGQYKLQRDLGNSVARSIFKSMPHLPAQTIESINKNIIGFMSNMSNGIPERHNAFAMWVPAYIHYLEQKGAVKDINDFMNRRVVDKQAATQANDFVARSLGYAPDKASKGTHWNGSTADKIAISKLYSVFRQQAWGLSLEFQNNMHKGYLLARAGNRAESSAAFNLAISQANSILMFRAAAIALGSVKWFGGAMLWKFFDRGDDEESKRKLLAAKAAVEQVEKAYGANIRMNSIKDLGVDTFSTVVPLTTLGPVMDLMLAKAADQSGYIIHADDKYFNDIEVSAKADLKKELELVRKQIDEKEKLLVKLDKLGSPSFQDNQDELEKLEQAERELAQKANFKYFPGISAKVMFDLLGGYGMLAEKVDKHMMAFIADDLPESEKAQLEDIMKTERAFNDPLAGAGFPYDQLKMVSDIARKGFPEEWGKEEGEQVPTEVFWKSKLMVGQNPSVVAAKTQALLAKEYYLQEKERERNLKALRDKVEGPEEPTTEE